MKLLLSTYLAALTTTFCAVVAVPAATNDLVERENCNFSGTSGASQAIAKKKTCSSITLTNVVVPAGTTLDLTGLNDGTQVIFAGTTTFGYKEWTGPLISISGTNIQISGSSGHLIDGGGARWWDGQGGNGGKVKPKFFAAHNLKGNSAITGLHIQNTPVQVYSISGSSGLTITNPIVDNKAGDSQGGHNTDAFDIGTSDHITITGAQVYNQDDCVAVNSGSNIIFSGGYCSGGHGLSIGSVGGRSDNTVENVQFLSTHVVNSDNGVRIKTVKGATGSVKGVTYKDITLQNITKYGVVIAQNYDGGGFKGTPTTGVPISGLTLNNVQGTVASSGTNIMIECGSSSSCSGWTWELVKVSGGKPDICNNAPSGTC